MFNTLEHDIHSLRNDVNILLLGEFNARTTTIQAPLLSNNSHLNPFCLEEVFDLASRLTINFEGINREFIWYRVNQTLKLPMLDYL